MSKWYIILVVAFVACAGPESPKVEDGEATEVEEEMVRKTSYMSYGKKINTDGAVKIAGLNVEIQDKDTIQIKLEAVINETCSKKGC
ncbi:MAG: hypothetical protein JKY42_04325, partial [Flavobacteriales bacterium]|nr:hypothetical protein [Flavobacteriales bacterium]